MDTTNLVAAQPPVMPVLPPNPGITPYELYQLSDHLAAAYTDEQIAGTLV